MTTSTTYELRLAGHLDDHWSATLGDLTLARCDDGTATLQAPRARIATRGYSQRIIVPPKIASDLRFFGRADRI